MKDGRKMKEEAVCVGKESLQEWKKVMNSMKNGRRRSEVFIMQMKLSTAS